MYVCMNVCMYVCMYDFMQVSMHGKERNGGKERLQGIQGGKYACMYRKEKNKGRTKENKGAKEEKSEITKEQKRERTTE